MTAKYTIKKHLKGLLLKLLLAAILFGSGCATSSPPAPDPLTGRELQVFMSRSKYPEMLSFEIIERPDGIYARNANQIKAARRAIADFASPRKSVLPAIEVESRGGKGMKMLLDTSSRKSWISYRASEEFQVIPVGSQPYRYAATHLRDPAIGILTSAPYLRIEKMLMTSGLLYVRADKSTLWPVSRSYRKPEIDLVMGCGMMKAYSFIRIDYDNREVAFVAEEIYPDTGENIIASVPIIWKNGAIAVNAKMDGKDQLVFIDTGGDFELTRPNAETQACSHIFIEDLAIIEPTVRDAREFLIAGREFPSIGSRLLSRYTLVIDMTRQQIHFVRP